MATSFQSRLENVQRARAPFEAARPAVSPLPDWKANIRQPVTLAALFAGGAAVTAALILGSGRLVAETALFDLSGTIIAAVVGAAGLFAARGQGSGKARAMPLLGALVVAAGLHNLVHRAPAVFHVAAGEAWTSRVLQTCPAGSLIFAGETYMLAAAAEPAEDDAAPRAKPEPGFNRSDKNDGADDAEKPALPAVRRMN